MNLITELIEKNTPPRPCIKIQGPVSITIHWIGPYPKQSIRDPVNWWVSQKLQASAHYVVKENDVLNCIPIDEVAWHCGSKGNYSSIGIEVVPADEDGIFSVGTIGTLKELIATFPKLPLKRHYDWTGKNCPNYYTPAFGPDGDAHWQELIKELQNG